MDLSDLIERNAAFAPDKPAIRFEGESSQLTRRSMRASNRRRGR